ncbi:hypothetical protein AGMMS50293_05700 [Spirochaetia bacterium]|nr:hypothetical protein AGMMS50293_05700 [Spirochaetia bacterium]
MNFDASKNWIILAGREARNAAAEMALYISLLRTRAGLGSDQPQIENAETASPVDSVPLIILSVAAGSPDHNGFSWRLGSERIEIYGDSLRGLWNGVFDFLAALGICWPKPGQEELPGVAPSAGAAANYPVQDSKVHSPSASSPQERRRLVIGRKTSAKERELLIRWAAHNKYDALVFSLGEKSLWAKRGGLRSAGYYALMLEAGGHDLSLLLPRRLFLLHRDLFRMELGKRTAKRHFCPTNPKTIAYITMQARKLFSRTLAGMTAAQPDSTPNAQIIRVFHLWPDSGHENTWCVCGGVYRNAVLFYRTEGAAGRAGALLEVDQKALLLYIEEAVGTEPADAAGGIALRNNIFALVKYPDKIQNIKKYP